LNVYLNREKITNTFVNSIKKMNKSGMYNQFEFYFKDEEGIDAGGLTREAFELAAKEIFNPNFGLFMATENG